MAVGLPSGRWGQTLALGLTLVAATMLWAGIVAPLRDAFDDRSERLRGDQAMIGRMEALMQTLPALRDQAGSAAAPSGMTLPGDTDPIAAAALQQSLDALADSHGVRIASEEILPAQTAGSFRTIGVHVTANAPYASVVALLGALAKADTPMIVAELALRGTGPARGQGDTRLVNASFTVTSYRRAEPAHAAGGTQGDGR
jgi:hypothetical protein